MKKPIGVTNARSPKVNTHGGKTWDTVAVIMPDGTKIEGYLDTTWGAYVYFEIGGKWYKCRVTEVDNNWKVTLKS